MDSSGDITFYPTNDMTTANTYQVIVKTHGASSRNDGLALQSSTATAYSLALQVLSSAGSPEQAALFTYFVPNALFTTLKVDVLHITRNKPNAFYIYLTTNPVETDIIIIQFPTISRGATTTNLFDIDLGTGIANGDTIGCNCDVCGANYKCYLFHGDRSKHLPAEVHIKNPVVNPGPGANTAYTVIIPGIVNPDSANDEGIIDIRVMRVGVDFQVKEEQTARNVFAPTLDSSTSGNWVATDVSFSQDNYNIDNKFTFGYSETDKWTGMLFN